jgi:hypothetical protein
MAGSVLRSLQCPPMLSTLTRTVVPVAPQRTKMSGCLQVCDGCSRPRSGLRPDGLLPHPPGMAGGGPPPWSRSSRMAIACLRGKDLRLTLCAMGATSYLPPGNTTPPVCTVTASHRTGIAGSGQGRSRLTPPTLLLQAQLAC